MAKDSTEQADEAPKSEPRPRRGSADTEPEPSIRPGSLSRTLGHVALTAIAVLVLYTAYQHSRRDGDDDTSGNGTETAQDESTSTTSDGQVTTTTAQPGAAVEPTCPDDDGEAERALEFDGAPPMCIDPSQTYTAAVETSRGDFEITLEPTTAPQTVNNFVFLARWRYYEGAAFYSVVPELSIDTGDPISQDGQGDAGYTIPDELPTGESPYPELTVYMTNAGQENTNATEFAIVTGPEGERLPRRFTRFGTVTNGEDVVDAIEATGDTETLTGEPLEETVIERITITEQ